MTPREEKALEILEEVFPADSFMRPEIVRGGVEYEDEYGGTYYLPAEVDPPEDWEPVARVRYVARLSAPGYMDASGWVGGDDPVEVARELVELYGEF